MNTSTKQQIITLQPFNQDRLLNLRGNCDINLKQIEKQLEIEILNRGNTFQVIGDHKAFTIVNSVLVNLYQQTAYTEITSNQINLAIQKAMINNTEHKNNKNVLSVNTHEPIKPHGDNQAKYINNVQHHTINFAIGPAGTGKTFLAVAAALAALKKQQKNLFSQASC